MLSRSALEQHALLSPALMTGPHLEAGRLRNVVWPSAQERKWFDEHKASLCHTNLSRGTFPESRNQLLKDWKGDGMGNTGLKWPECETQKIVWKLYFQELPANHNLLAFRRILKFLHGWKLLSQLLGCDHMFCQLFFFAPYTNIILHGRVMHCKLFRPQCSHFFKVE